MNTEGSTNSIEVVSQEQACMKTEWGTNSTEVVSQAQTCMKHENRVDYYTNRAFCE
jgi:hypothetical protein